MAFVRAGLTLFGKAYDVERETPGGMLCLVDNDMRTGRGRQAQCARSIDVASVVEMNVNDGCAARCALLDVQNGSCMNPDADRGIDPANLQFREERK